MDLNLSRAPKTIEHIIQSSAQKRQSRNNCTPLRSEQNSKLHLTEDPDRQSFCESKFEKYRKTSEAASLKRSVETLKVLHSVGAADFIQKFEYPASTQEILQFIKESDLDLFEKILQAKTTMRSHLNEIQT